MRAAIAAWWSDTSAPRNLWCNARVAAITLYERLGFVAEGERFEFPQVGPHQRMRWVAP
jgi:ribosomal protein S18 acetylase RimI-like enzyme